jgi:dCTP deaminase
MSIIIKRGIIEHIRNGELSFDPPLDELQLRPHAVDLRLGFRFRIPKSVVDKEKGRSALTLDHYSLKKGQFAYFEEIRLKPGQHFDILPGESIIGFSLEKIDLKSPMLMGTLYPRSSVNRRGLAVDLTGVIDAGYKGYLMFPIRNNTSMQVIRIYPGERICQIVFERLDQPVPDGYKGRYASRTKARIPFAYLTEASTKEIQLVRKGKIQEIKRKFAIDLKR